MREASWRGVSYYYGLINDQSGLPVAAGAWVRSGTAVMGTVLVGKTTNQEATYRKPVASPTASPTSNILLGSIIAVAAAVARRFI